MQKERAVDIDKEYSASVFDKREEQWVHVPYEHELVLLDLIKNGNVERIKELMYDVFPIHDSHLSNDPLRQRKYEFVSVLATVSRFAIEGGLDGETAFSLSDAYIHTMDTATTQEEVLELLQKVPLDFAARVRDARKRPVYSRPVLRCIEYIESNLHFAITLDNLAEYAGRTAAYLSVLFKKETGQTIKEHIALGRLAEARRMLAYSDMAISQIATVLGFNSQSYFSQQFRRYSGETPKEYREQSLRRENHSFVASN